MARSEKQTEPKPCPLCGGSAKRAGVNPPSLVVLRCVTCGFSYLAVSDSEILATNVCGEEQTERYARLQSAFDAAYFEWVLRSLQRHGSPLLDVGCGNGVLLRAAGRLGFTPEGFDPSPWAQDRGFKVYAKWSDVPAKSYRVVTCLSTLEHVPHPAEFVADIAARLTPGGVAYFTVPNYGGLESLCVPERLRAQDKPYHCNFFRAKDLRFIAEKLGLQHRVRSYGLPGLWSLWRKHRLGGPAAESSQPAKEPSRHEPPEQAPSWKHRFAVRAYYWTGLMLGSKLEMTLYA
jgi:2-polyprenyl-3-methyl-5-hydroxy-6-metoxy-1,4-benzoquinol methylase